MAELSGLLWWNFAYTLILTRCSQRDCQMLFGIGRGAAEVQNLKNTETGPISWNILNIFNKIMHKHCYWRELVRGIAKCHLFFMKVCIIIDIDSNRDCLSGYGVVTSGEAFKTIGVGVVHFSVNWLSYKLTQDKQMCLLLHFQQISILLKAILQPNQRTIGPVSCTWVLGIC